MYEYNTRFRGFRRDIWWDERELKSNHVKKVKTIKYQGNRFIFLLDGIKSIHGVTPLDTSSVGYRMRLSGGINTKPKHKNYDYRKYLKKNEIAVHIAGIQIQKIHRKLNRYFK